MLSLLCLCATVELVPWRGRLARGTRGGGLALHDFLHAVRSTGQDVCSAPGTGRMCCYRDSSGATGAAAFRSSKQRLPPRHQRGDSGSMNLFLHGAAALGAIPAPSPDVLVVDVSAAST